MNDRENGGAARKWRDILENRESGAFTPEEMSLCFSQLPDGEDRRLASRVLIVILASAKKPTEKRRRPARKTARILPFRTRETRHG